MLSVVRGREGKETIIMSSSYLKRVKRKSKIVMCIREAISLHVVCEKQKDNDSCVDKTSQDLLSSIRRAQLLLNTRSVATTAVRQIGHPLVVTCCTQLMQMHWWPHGTNAWVCWPSKHTTHSSRLAVPIIAVAASAAAMTAVSSASEGCCRGCRL